MRRAIVRGHKIQGVKNVGVIAEDESDVAVISRLMEKLTKNSFVIRRFVGCGCGKIIGKCNAWATNLHIQGCRYLILVHDLDKKDLGALKLSLKKALDRCPISNHTIVIPIQEIEAWLLADSVAIAKVMNIRTPLKRISDPESINNPKEYLARLIYMKSGHTRSYINTVHNEKLARVCSINELKRCGSFRLFQKFVVENI